MTVARGTVRDVALVCAAALGTTALIAAVVAVWLEPATRASLQWSFPGAPRTLDGATGIFLTNATKILGVAGATLVVQAPWIGAEQRAVRVGIGWHATRLVCDVVGVYIAAANMLLVGAGIGAYGARMLVALLPHGPVELLAFAQGAAIYLRARRGPVDWRSALVGLAAAFLTLALAAVLETFVPV